VPPPGSASEFLQRIFLNESGLRAGWRLLVYAAIAAGLGVAGGVLLQVVLPDTHDLFSPGYWLVYEIFGFLVVFGAACIMAQVEKRPAGVYGLPAKEAFAKKFWTGWLIGLAEVSLLVGLITLFGGYSFGGLALHGSEIVRWGALWMILFLFVGLFEEFLFRGYTQYTLADGIGFWPAAILLCFTFGYVHKRNPGEDWMGALSVAAIGMVLAFALKRTGNLWLPVGLHASFDFGETFLFSVPNSGIVFDHHLSNASLHGPHWLTGGSVGPEGSVLSFATMGLVALAIHVLFPARAAATSAHGESVNHR
jgi:membrane protease YdiL (CAAX protease family)